MPAKKRTPEQQNTLIERKTKGRPRPYPMPWGKRGVLPHWCEHCDGTMTITGRLPALTDSDSWAHWIGCAVDGDHGVLKVHSTLGHYGHCCTGCFENYQQWAEEAEESDRIFMAQRELQQAQTNGGAK